MWGAFPKTTTDKMVSQGLVLHAHSFSVRVDSFENSILNDTWKITQSDTLALEDGSSVKFIGSMESKEYSIFSTMYHPEYQMLEFAGKKKWNLVNNDTTDEIGYRLSMKVNRLARTNGNRIDGQNEAYFWRKYGLNRVPASIYPMIPDLSVYSYGYTF